MSTHTTIQCPECGSDINVNDILKHQIEDQMKQEFARERKKLLDEQKARESILEKAKLELEARKKQQDELFRERLEKEKREATLAIEKRLKAKLEEDNQEQLRLIQEELKEKSEKVKDLLKKEAEIEKLKREKEEAMELAKVEAQKELNAELVAQKERIKKEAAAASELQILELKKQLEDQKKLTEEMKRKQEQGSMQLQGEAQELAIEEWLMTKFPLDTIDEVKKGALGGDCLQVVNTREQANCGTIYYESKRTKNFQPSWIEKFKNDIREKGADIGVLVTEVMPADMERMGMKEGIWICTFEEFKSLCNVLRQSVVKWSTLKLHQENKGDKMGMLYDFLTSTEFKLQMEGIVEGFSQMQLDLQKEKNAMKRIWKQREKQIEKVIGNAIHMHASIRGIAGSAVQSIPALELDREEQEALAIES
ncbi:DUF2130 domain-containing protein [Robertkochia sediminum]|uniref:DUF2130 domain-containing protein n=1 Tax=Robertkochia sediminum TaxID=2785326 RepID=UPI00193433AC|nr:DUF2130 domain-containing protein [Robertkochia sediminum]MBL7471379.1 DUF2130 domain-containing protein [Robertkochia sediminum]